MFRLTESFREQAGEGSPAGGSPDAAGAQANNPGPGEGAAGAGEGAPGAGEGTPEGNADAWYAGFEDESVRDWAAGKGWKSPEAAVKSALNAEKLIGAPAEELLRVPGNLSDNLDGARPILERLGLPKEASAYELPVPEGAEVDEAFQGWARESFHKAGLTAAQAKALTESWNEFQGGNAEQIAEDYDLEVQQGEQNLQREWGNGYERQIAAAQNATKALGFSKDMVDGIEQAIGYEGTMKFMAELASKLGEDKYVDSEVHRQGFHSQMTPAEAKQAWSEMASNPEMQAALGDKFHPGHKEAMEKKQRLFAVMYPDG